MLQAKGTLEGLISQKQAIQQKQEQNSEDAASAQGQSVSFFQTQEIPQHFLGFCASRSQVLFPWYNGHELVETGKRYEPSARRYHAKPHHQFIALLYWSLGHPQTLPVSSLWLCF